MDTLREMIEEERENAYYAAVRRDDVIGDAFSFDAHANIPEAIARMRYELLRYVMATPNVKRSIAESFGEWILETANDYVKGAAENEY